MEEPFLEPDGEEKWLTVRFWEVADAVEQYLYTRDGEPIPDRDPVTEKPEPLEELERFEFYNWQMPPRTGGLYDQPYYFLEDLRAAAEGRARYLLTQTAQPGFTSPIPEPTDRVPQQTIDLNEYFNIE